MQFLSLFKDPPREQTVTHLHIAKARESHGQRAPVGQQSVAARRVDTEATYNTSESPTPQSPSLIRAMTHCSKQRQERILRSQKPSSWH